MDVETRKKYFMEGAEANRFGWARLLSPYPRFSREAEVGEAGWDWEHFMGSDEAQDG